MSRGRDIKILLKDFLFQIENTVNATEPNNNFFIKRFFLIVPTLINLGFPGFSLSNDKLGGN